jgi:shikimate dehydrogenase
MSRKYAILGETLKHTMSPPIHARLFELKNREYEYEILEVKPEELKDKAEYLNSLNGYNFRTIIPVNTPYSYSIAKPNCSKAK